MTESVQRLLQQLRSGQVTDDNRNDQDGSRNNQDGNNNRDGNNSNQEL